MTIAELRSRVRELSRMTTSGMSDTNVDAVIIEAIKAFAVDVHGLPLYSYLSLDPAVSLSPTLAFNLEITGSTNNDIAPTDIPIATAEAMFLDATDVALDLQDTVRTSIGSGADAAVTWDLVSANLYRFALNGIDANCQITIGSPVGLNYGDATDYLWGTTGTQTGTFEGGFPEGVNWRADLPEGCQNVLGVYWDDTPLKSVDRSMVSRDMGEGTPTYYNIRGDKIYFYPTPSSQASCFLEYKGVPEVSTADMTSAIGQIPTEYHRILVYWTAAELLKDQFEEERAQMRYRDYLREKARYSNSMYNRSTASPASAVAADPTFGWSYRVKV